MGAVLGIVLGVVAIIVLGIAGLMSGAADSPETKEWIEKERKRKQRQEEWKRKVGGHDDGKGSP